MDRALADRIKGFVISEAMFNTLLRHGATVRCMAGIPADADFVGCNYDHRLRAFVAAFAHASFELTPVGQEIPLEMAGFEILDDPHGQHMGEVYEFRAADRASVRPWR